MDDLAPVFKQFRAKVSPHLGKIMRASPAVARQFLPDRAELATYGTPTPFEEGKNNRGIYGLERIYAERAVLTPYFECSAYCRYCFKKTRTLAGEAKRMSADNIRDAVRYIADDSRIRTVLITGGDPLVDPDLLKYVLDQVTPIPHVRFIRVGTRNILFAPQSVTDALADMLASYNVVDCQNLERSKTLSLGFSLNHVDELTPEVIQATRRLIDRGLTVRGQVALLRGVNDEGYIVSHYLDGEEA